MARIRTIKPIHWNDKELSKISLSAHLLWIATWNFSDDEGVFEGDTLLLKSQIFPRRTDVRVEQISQWLDQLVTARFLIPFTFNNEGYYVSRTFKTHQRIDKAQPSKIPLDVLKKVFEDYSKNIPRTVSPVLGEYSKGEEGIPPPAEKTPTKEQKLFLAFQKWILKEAPRVAQLKDPFTLEQYLKIREEFSKEQVKDILMKMHNWKPLLSKNLSANLTIRNWIKTENEKGGRVGNFSHNSGDTVASETLQARKKEDLNGSR